MKRLSHTLIVVVFIILMIICIGCRRTLSFPKEIIIPQGGFAIESCTKAMTATCRMFFYVEYKGCPSCKINDFQKIENELRTVYKNNDIEFIYIVETDSLHKYTAYSMFCNARLKGHVYVDTTKRFLSANPSFSRYCMNYVFILDSLNNVKKTVSYPQMRNLKINNIVDM